MTGRRSRGSRDLRAGAYRRKDAKGIKDDLDYVYALFPRLLERETQLAGTLSGGEQQMLAMGRALMGKPKLMLLDEPSLGIAPIVVRDIFRSLKEINQKGITILFVEQNSKIALETANRGYVMQVGEIVAEGTSKELMSDETVKKAYLGG